MGVSVQKTSLLLTSSLKSFTVYQCLPSLFFSFIKPQIFDKNSLGVILSLYISQLSINSNNSLALQLKKNSLGIILISTDSGFQVLLALLLIIGLYLGFSSVLSYTEAKNQYELIIPIHSCLLLCDQFPQSW
jgi:hypothetical protein